MKVVTNVLRVLEAIAKHGPISLARLHAQLGLPKTTTHRALEALEVAGWVRREGEGPRWELTPRAAVIGRRAAEADGVREMALPEMRKLRDATGEAIHLTRPDGADLVLIERLDSPQAVRTHNPIGARAPLHASANGKAILSTWSPDEVKALLPAVLPDYTEQTMTDLEGLERELARIRKHGFATNRGEWVADVGAVASAIAPGGGRAVASISVSAPIHRLPAKRAKELGPSVLAAALRVAESLSPNLDPS